MNAARPLSSPYEPAAIVKWLLIVFAVGMLAFNAWNVTDPFLIIMSFEFLPLSVGSVGLAALLATRARSTGEAWLFVGALAVADAFTAWFGIKLTFVNGRNGIGAYVDGLLSLQLVQFAVLLVYALGVIAMADLVMANRQQEKPRSVLLTVLSIACASFLVVLSWWFGYIRI